MNHWQRCTQYMHSIIEVFNGREVRITGYGVPGAACCEAIDGLEPIYEISTAFLIPENVRVIEQ